MSCLLPSPVLDLLFERGNFFHDIYLIDQDVGRHPANKALLATHSPFFLALFASYTDDVTEFHLKVVKRTSNNAAGLFEVLNWIERGELKLNKGNVLDVLQTAIFTDINHLKLSHEL